MVARPRPGHTRFMSHSERITAAVTAWPGVEAGTGRRGEYGFRVGRKELGHLHGDRAVPRRVPQGRVARAP